MKTIIFIIIFSIFISSCCLVSTMIECPYIPYVLERQEALGEIKAITYLDKKATQTHERTFYIVEPEMLKRARNAAYLSYLGSIENYHLLRVWVKCHYSEDEIHFFAVEKKHCDVENERSLKDEIGELGNWRRVVIVNGKCVVKKRKRLE